MMHATREWEAQQSNNLALTVTIGSTAEYKAQFGIRYTLTFTNSFPETVGASSIMVDGAVQTGTTFPVNVYSDRSMTVAAVDQTINSVNMSFDHWSDGQSAGSATRDFINPQADANYTIYYQGTPTAVPNWASTCELWEAISMSWSEHPNANVSQYQVWRRVGSDPASLLQTLNRGTTSFVDGEYILTPPRVLIVNYDIRPYYSPSGTTSEPVWHSFYTNPLYKKVVDRKTPTEYRVGNYPNPFNPSTTITYQIVDDAEVAINICDLAGRVVKSVLNEHKPAGYYAATWDGKTESGQAAASGVYFFLFKAKPVNGNAMVVRTGKLLLTK